MEDLSYSELEANYARLVEAYKNLGERYAGREKCWHAKWGPPYMHKSYDTQGVLDMAVLYLQACESCNEVRRIV